MIDQISLENRKLASELSMTKNVNSTLEERIINLEKNQAKGEQCSRRNTKMPTKSRLKLQTSLQVTIISFLRYCPFHMKRTLSQEWNYTINWRFTWWYMIKIKIWSEIFLLGIVKNMCDQSGHGTLNLNLSKMYRWR